MRQVGSLSLQPILFTLILANDPFDSESLIGGIFPNARIVTEPLRFARRRRRATGVSHSKRSRRKRYGLLGIGGSRQPATRIFSRTAGRDYQILEAGLDPKNAIALLKV